MRSKLRKFAQPVCSPAARLHAGHNLIFAAHARAMVHGQSWVNCWATVAVALPFLRHCIMLSFPAKGESVTAAAITRKILETVPKDEKLK